MDDGDEDANYSTKPTERRIVAPNANESVSASRLRLSKVKPSNGKKYMLDKLLQLCVMASSFPVFALLLL